MSFKTHDEKPLYPNPQSYQSVETVPAKILEQSWHGKQVHA